MGFRGLALGEALRDVCRAEDSSICRSFLECRSFVPRVGSQDESVGVPE